MVSVGHPCDLQRLFSEIDNFRAVNRIEPHVVEMGVCKHEQVLRSLSPSITMECTHFCGEYIFCWAMQNGCPCLIALNMAAPWRKAI